MPLKKTGVGVFIIESVNFLDEAEKRNEGKVLTAMLNLLQIPNQYKYIRTTKEFDSMMKQFKESNMRYLHISCHGSPNKMAFALDGITFNRFAKDYSKILARRRVFLSACSVGSKNLADNIFRYTECKSIIGPSEEIYFHKAAIFWASFYHLMFEKINYQTDSNLIINNHIIEIINTLCPLYDVNLNCYFKSKIGYQTHEFHSDEKAIYVI